MSGNLNMSYWQMENIAAAIDQGDPINKVVLDNALKKIH